jgi:hypothetical protein
MGTLVVNLQSLEFALRGFLHNWETGWANQGGPSFLENITEGQQLEENAFTNYDTLRELIDKYNSKVRPTNPDLEVDPGITCIRDALAHGRIASQSPLANVPQRLVKYDRPKDGLVRVTDCYTLTKEWFDEKIKWAYESIKKVSEANERHWSKQ